MMYSGRYIFSYSDDTFWHNFFANKLHFPFPDLMFFLAKGSEFFGGLFLVLGFMTRISAVCIAFAMLIATLFANIEHVYGGYGSITVSYFLFAVLFILVPSKILSLDWMIRKRRSIHRKSFAAGQKTVQIFFICMRVWFGSLLLYNGIYAHFAGPPDLFFNWIFKSGGPAFPTELVWPVSVVEIICGLFIAIGLFTKKTSSFIALCMTATIIAAAIAHADFASYFISMIVIIFWFACIFCNNVGHEQ